MVDQAMDKLRVMLVDDRIILREGIHAVLEAEDDIEVVAEATRADEAFSYYQDLVADIVVTNSRLEHQIMGQIPSASLIVIDDVTHLSPEDLVRMVRNGPASPSKKTNGQSVHQAKEALRSYFLRLTEGLEGNGTSASSPRQSKPVPQSYRNGSNGSINSGRPLSNRFNR
jgi:chemotaxis response regulator CheB